MAQVIPASELVGPVGAFTFTPGDTAYVELVSAVAPVVGLPDRVKTVYVYAASDVRVSFTADDGQVQAAFTEYEIAAAGVRTPFRLRDGARILVSLNAAISLGFQRMSVA